MSGLGRDGVGGGADRAELALACIFLRKKYMAMAIIPRVRNDPVPPLSQFDPENTLTTAFSSIISTSSRLLGSMVGEDVGRYFHRRITTIRITTVMVIAMTAGRFMLTVSWLTVNWLCSLDSGINGVDFVQFCTVGGGVQRVESFDIRVLQAGAESGLARVSHTFDWET